MVPVYDGPGLESASNRIYPIMANEEDPMIKGARRLYRSDSTAMVMVVMNAMAYGGIVRS